MKKNTLQHAYPLLAAEWHPTKNGSLISGDVTPKSGRKIWWLCTSGHSYPAVINKRTLRSQGCPYCGGKLATPETCLAKVNPQLVKEWDNVKNKKLGLTPFNVKPGSGKKAWWKCPQGHSYFSAISSRSSGTGCPYCKGAAVFQDTSFQARYPGLASNWDYEKNSPITPDKIKPGTHKKYFFRCSDNSKHIFNIAVYAFIASKGSCPYCNNKRVDSENCLTAVYPALAIEWHPTENGKVTPSDVLPGSGKKRWWLCPVCHLEYEETPNKRTSANEGCPFCSGRRVSDRNRLSILRPDIAEIWHPTLNGSLTPADVSVSSDKKVAWLCEKGHTTYVAVKTMVRRKRNGCKYCYGREATPEYNLAVKYPEIIKEWNWNKNDLTPYNYSPSSNKKVYWLCSKGHIYQMQISNKINRQRCPKCHPKLSMKEARLFSELKFIFPEVSKQRFDRFEVDAYIKDLKLGIEYDGRYYHQNRIKKEIVRNKYFYNQGITIIRLREKPLKKISYFDLLVNACELTKENIDRLLKSIVSINKLDPTVKGKIISYLEKDSFQNNRFYLELIKNYNKPPAGKSLSDKFPALAKEWDKPLNEPITPDMMYAHAKNKYWWKCEIHGPFFSSVDHRSRGTGCPECSGRIKSIHF